MKLIIALALLVPTLSGTPVWADTVADIRALKKTIATIQAEQRSQSKRLTGFATLRKRVANVESSTRIVNQSAVAKTSANSAAKLERRIVELEKAQKRGGLASRSGTNSSPLTHEELVQKFLSLRTRVSKIERASGYGKIWKDIRDEFSFLGRKLSELESRIKDAEKSAVSVNGGKLILSAPIVEISGSQLIVKTGQSIFSGPVKVKKLTTKSVISERYTPGVGNVQ